LNSSIFLTAEHCPADNPDAKTERRAAPKNQVPARELINNQTRRHHQTGPVSLKEEFDSEWEARGDSAG
jgi:hypothetical protein